MKLKALLLIPLVVLGYGHTATAGQSSGYPFPILNLKATYPQIVSVELGLSYQLGDQNADTRYGPFLSYEPGLNGQKIHLGYCMTSFQGILDTIIVARMSASYYHSWSTANGFQAGDNCYGLEVVGSYDLMLISGGVYFNGESRKFTGTVGVGIGF